MIEVSVRRVEPKPQPPPITEVRLSMGYAEAQALLWGLEALQAANAGNWPTAYRIAELLRENGVKP